MKCKIRLKLSQLGFSWQLGQCTLSKCLIETEVKKGATKMKVLYKADGSGIIDQVLLKLEGDNALNCIFGIEFGLGGGVTTLENIECTHMTGITGKTNIFTNVNLILMFADIFSDKDDFAYTLEYENNIEFLMLEQIIHYFGTNSMGKLQCKGYLGKFQIATSRTERQMGSVFKQIYKID